MKSSLPDIKIPIMGKIQALVGSVACSIEGLTQAIDEFEKNFRGPILAYCVRIEFLIDSLNEIMFFYLLNITYCQENRNFFSSVLIDKHFFLNKKIMFCLDLLEVCEKNIHKDKQNYDVDKAMKLIKTHLNSFRKIRNIFAHAKVEPRVNSKQKVIDVYLSDKKITKKYITNIFKDLEIIDSVLSKYCLNFNTAKKK